MDDGDPAAVRMPQHTVVVEIWEFPKTRGTILGVPRRRTIVIILWSILGPPILGTYHICSWRWCLPPSTVRPFGVLSISRSVLQDLLCRNRTASHGGLSN